MWSFLPLDLFIQFSKASNIYFTIITAMQMIDLISISNGQPAMALPLSFVVLLSMIKDAFEDYKRSKADSKENDSLTLVFDSKSRSFNPIEWKNIHVGNILKLKDDEMVPADVLLLNTSDVKGVCYVETKGLDGETNLKIKSANKEMMAKLVSEKELGDLSGTIKCEGPNNAIYKFEGMA
jgi:phospholipid-transporting ATPase